MTETYAPSIWRVEQQEMLKKMIQHQLNRGVGKETYIREIFPSLSTIHDLTILGMFSWTSNAAKWRMILEPHAYNYGGGWCTPSDVARDYLSIKYPDRRLRCTTLQYKACCVNPPSSPLYAKPQADFEGVYIDIKGAYWQIIKAFGWDVDYCPSRYIGVNSSMADFPFPENKLARNCMVSIGLPGSITIWTGRRLVVQKKKNKFINLILWKAVQDVLHGIALDAVSAGALYVYTDGFIVSSEKASAVMGAIEAWGMETHIKYQGLTTIRGCGDYTIPGHISKRKPTQRTEEFSNLYEPDRKFLRGRVAKMATAAIVF